MEVLSSRVLLSPLDFDRSRRWYIDVLGLRIYREFGANGRLTGVVLFLGGFTGLLPIPFVPDFIAGPFWFLIKTLFLVFVMMWIRWTLPRLRVDQLMGMCWKYLIPISLVNLAAIGLWTSLSAGPK